MRRKEFRQGSTRVRPPVRPPTAWRSYYAANPRTIGGLGGLTFKPSLLLVFEHRQALAALLGGLTSYRLKTAINRRKTAKHHNWRPYWRGKACGS